MPANIHVTVGSTPPEFPTPTSVGVPVGTTLTDDARSTLATANEVIVGKRFAANLEVTANGVVLRNCELLGGINNFSGQGSFTLEDSTIGPASDPTGDPGFAVGATAFTMRRCLIRNCPDGIRVSGRDSRPITIEGNFITTAHFDGAHSDGMQADANVAPYTISGNTFDITPSAPDFTSCIFNGSSDPTGVLTCTHNLLVGGGYVFTIGAGTGHIITDNIIADGSFQYGPANVVPGIIAQWSNNHLATINDEYTVTSVGAEIPLD